MDQYELALRALRSLKPGEKRNIALVEEHMALIVRSCQDIFTGFAARKKTHTTINDY
jgi:hypothetical protein